MSGIEEVEAVGVVCVSRFKNRPEMENVEFQQVADIPQGQHDVMTIAQHNRIVEQYKRNAERKFTVGDLTYDLVFKASGLTNLSDMQAVLDAVERALNQQQTERGAGDD